MRKDAATVIDELAENNKLEKFKSNVNYRLLCRLSLTV